MLFQRLHAMLRLAMYEDNMVANRGYGSSSMCAAFAGAGPHAHTAQSSSQQFVVFHNDNFCCLCVGARGRTHAYDRLFLIGKT